MVGSRVAEKCPEGRGDRFLIGCVCATLGGSSSKFLLVRSSWARSYSDRVHDISDSARLFALANLAMADAGITAWDTKFHYVFWRPVTAIQEGDNDGNPETVGDPNWQRPDEGNGHGDFFKHQCSGRHPLINTPNYPDYTSGANRMCARRDSNSRPIAPEAVQAPSIIAESSVYSRSTSV